MSQQVDNLFLTYAAIEVLLIVVPIIGCKIFFIKKIIESKDDRAFILNPMSWYTLFLESPNNKNGSLFTAQLLIILFTIGIIPSFLVETYDKNIGNALSGSKNTTVGQVINTVKHPDGHGMCVVTYQYEITDSDNITRQYTQGWRSNCSYQLEPGTPTTVWYVSNHPLISFIGNGIGMQVVPEVRNAYLIISTITIIVLIVINRGMKQFFRDYL
ncbi:MAG: hypothetical protein GY931_20235 [Maribacter sp.]|nr:hypothetical protein [Maribacter sp.]